MNRHVLWAAGLLAAGSLAWAVTPNSETPVTAFRTTRDLTLDDAVQIALRQNPDILRAEQEIKRTRGEVIEVRAQALPQITVTDGFSQVDKGLLRSGGGSNTGSGSSNGSGSSTTTSGSGTATSSGSTMSSGGGNFDRLQLGPGDE